jgi:hypothetical protein
MTAFPSISTPVYEKPDGWSKVLCELLEAAAVTVCGTEGRMMTPITEEFTTRSLRSSSCVVSAAPIGRRLSGRRRGRSGR